MEQLGDSRCFHFQAAFEADYMEISCDNGIPFLTERKLVKGDKNWVLHAAMAKGVISKEVIEGFGRAENNFLGRAL
jgi:hypothetical protein